MSRELETDLTKFLDKLENELHDRYQLCDNTATPDSILLAVLNAINAARLK